MRISKLFQVIIFPIFFCLLSCDNKGIIPSKDLSEVNIENQEFEENLDSIPSSKVEYLFLLNIARTMQLYVDGSLPNSIDLREKHQASEEHIQIFGRKDIERLNNETLELVIGKKNIDDFLYNLLEFRFRYLVTRDTTINKILDKEKIDGPIQPITPLPTDKQLFKWVVKGGGFHKPQIKNFKKQVRFEIGRFELLNMLIKETFLRCDLNKLSTKTIQLLQASVQLHSLLAGTSEDLGHPDKASVSYYMLLKDIIMPTTHLPILRLLQNQAIQETKSENFIENNRMEFLTYLFQLVKLKETEESNLELKQLISAIKEITDVEVYKAHFIPKIQHIQLKGLGTPEGHCIKTLTTDYKADKWIHELPKPSFLETKDVELNIIEKSEVSKNFSSVKKKNPRKKKKGNPTQKLKQQSSPSAKTPIEGNIIEAVSVPTTNLQIEETDTYQPTMVTFTPLTPVEKEEVKIILPPMLKQKVKKEKEEKIKETESEREIPLSQDYQTEKKEELEKPKLNLHSTKKQDTQGTKDETYWPFEEFCPLPRWLRAFHNKAKWDPCLGQKTISNKHQQIVDDLFDPSKQCNVTYKAFKAVFEGAGGKIESTSGSHRALLDSRGNRIPGVDLFVHSNGQTFPKGFIKNLQIAVLYMGLRPSREIKNS